MNGSLSREDGEKWDSGCDQCQCKSGVVTCIRKKCDELKCKNPVMDEGECCPKCLSKCGDVLLWNFPNAFPSPFTLSRDLLSQQN